LSLTRVRPQSETWLQSGATEKVTAWRESDRRRRTQALQGMTMKNRTMVGLLLVCCGSGAAASAAQLASTACDRDCLRGQMTQFLYALVKHDVSGVPAADRLRVTEDAVEKPLAKVGLVGTVTRLRGFRQDIIDERAGIAGAHVVVEESGAPVLLVVRLKVVADKLSEIELVATRSRSEGLIFNIDGLTASSGVMSYAPRPGQLLTRDDAIKAALHYPQGLNTAKTFAAGGDQLTVWETFKVYDSQIHAVEAFMRILPVEKRNGGWE
jgi:hypothetical protein